jgi:FKBP-type peptidyl-prolyl cis-trans isomerase
MRFLRLVACTLSPLAFTACLSGTETTSTNNGTPIDCATLATDLVGQESTLTTTTSGLKLRDPLVGTGAAASSGATVRIHYSGCLTTGIKFDENNDADPRGPLQFIVGDPQVIAGMNEGVVGMKVGGRRQLVIPPALGYGASANGPIPPNSTLVFTVDLVAAQ